jgi:hypothetical protein
VDHSGVCLFDLITVAGRDVMGETLDAQYFAALRDLNAAVPTKH